MGALNVNEHFKQLLDARFLELQAAIVNAEEEAREDLDIHADAVDQANSESDRESALRRKDLAEEALESLVSARERLHVGTFGKCVECGEDIGGLGLSLSRLERAHHRGVPCAKLGCSDSECAGPHHSNRQQLRED